MPACRLSTNKEEDAKKAYAAKKEDATAFSAVLGKDVPPHLMSTDKEEDAGKSESLADEGGYLNCFGNVVGDGFLSEGRGRMEGGGDVAGGGPGGPPLPHLAPHGQRAQISRKASELDFVSGFVCDRLTMVE